MCLVTKTRKVYTVKAKPKTFYKVLIADEGRYFTPIKNSRVRLNTIVIPYKSSRKVTELAISGFGRVEHGLHGVLRKKYAQAYINLLRSFHYIEDLIIVKMVLPVGTKYVTGKHESWKLPAVVATKAVYKRIK